MHEFHEVPSFLGEPVEPVSQSTGILQKIESVTARRNQDHQTPAHTTNHTPQHRKTGRESTSAFSSAEQKARSACPISQKDVSANWTLTIWQFESNLVGFVVRLQRLRVFKYFVVPGAKIRSDHVGQGA
jgi:hypothetical protein